MNETTKRIVSALAIAAVVIGALNYDGYGWIAPFLMVAAFALLGLFEFQVLVDRGVEGGPFRKTAFFFSVLILLAFYSQFLHTKEPSGAGLLDIHKTIVKYFYPSQFSLLPLLLVALLVVSSALQVLTRPLDGAIYSLSVTMLGVFYTTVGISHALLLYALPAGIFYLIFFALIPIASDTGAYFAGRWFGRHNAGLQVSPKKTYEGYLGGGLLAVLVGLGFRYGWQHYAASPSAGRIAMGLAEAGLVAFFLSFVSIFGDLVESALKRDARIKDSASTIPGHGGILDLADALFYCFPMGYLYLLLRQAYGFPL